MGDFRPNLVTNRNNAVAKAAFLAVVFQVTSISMNGMALGDENDQPTDAELERAFQLGLGNDGDLDGERQLVVIRFGPTFIFREANIGDEQSMELTCVLCTRAEALSKARSFGVDVGAKKLDRETSSVYFSEPSFDGWIEIDGIPLAPVLGSHNIEPGSHSISKKTKGHEVRAEVELQSGETLDLSTLEMSSVSWKVRPAIAMVGLGLTTAVLGGIFLWLDGQCANTIADLSGNCQNQYDLKGVGWGLLAAGAVIDVGALVWLFWPEHGHSQKKGEAE